MLKKLGLVVALVALPTAALADGITIYNNTASPIFKVFAWPKSLNPRTFNILGFPVFPGSTAEVAIDNTYGDCSFSFQYDVNDPAKLRMKNYKKKPLGFVEAYICGKNVFVWLGPLPDGKIQGRP